MFTNATRKAYPVNYKKNTIQMKGGAHLPNRKAKKHDQRLRVSLAANTTSSLAKLKSIFAVGMIHLY